MKSLLLILPLIFTMAACQKQTEIIRERVTIPENTDSTQTQKKTDSSDNTDTDNKSESADTSNTNVEDQNSDEQTVDPKSPGKKAAPATKPDLNNSKSMGGADTAGGDNGVQGKNLEDYAVSIQSETSFKQYVLPIILKLAEQSPRFASDMIHIAKERTWFIIPVELNKLSALRIGVNFADKDVQQFALQNLKAVWINRQHFRSFEDDQIRGRLILHEILMGVRLMKLKNSLDNCYSSIALMSLDKSKDKAYRENRKACELQYLIGGNDQSQSAIPGIGVDLKLEAHDYDSIRELGVSLWDSGGDMSATALQAWLKANDFRNY